MKKIFLVLMTVIFTNFGCMTSLDAAGLETRTDFEQISKQESYQATVKAVAIQLMQQYNIPGAAIAVIDGDQTYTYLFGSMDQANGRPVTENTIFEVGSITKLFTALLCAEAEDNKSIKLSDPLTDYCPKFKKHNSATAQITLTHLLTHTAGFPLNLSETITDKPQIAAHLSTWQPEKNIGSQWQYSNVGIGLAAMALENQTHKSINELMKENILRPLDMTPLGIEGVETYQENYAQGYSTEGKAVPHVRYDRDPFFSAYSLKATINDMSKFLAAAIGLPNTPDNIKKAMHNAQTPRVDNGNMQQGLAWQVHSLQDENIKHEPENLDLGPRTVHWLPKAQQIYKANVLLDKTGGTGGFRSYIAVVPEKELGVVILLNKYISNGAVVTAGRNIIGIRE
ncbi:serine hydrolase [Anaerosinus massiliensis]|uniref:serine hydrolase n=1 Tax=Massilibacillus massiliensis TaxID=1806837 RepID=UPI000B084A54|nr:serine hydrolase [Massilibacillus massiliensis]